MVKKYCSISLVSLAIAMIATSLSCISGKLLAQNRHAYLEDFVSASSDYGDYSPRADYTIQELYEQFPEQVAVLSFHYGDPMKTAQGDSLINCIGYPVSQLVNSFPDGWTARTTEGSSWLVDPSIWADSTQVLFGAATTYTPGLVDTIVAEKALVQCKVDSVSYDVKTNIVTARVRATFVSAMSGDFRLNLMVAEDSVSGPAGSGYDQYNYYSSADANVGALLPNNPYYSDPNPVTGWQHMHVFREAVAGIYGQSGIIPATVSAGGTYSLSFSFPLPPTILDPNHVHLVGMVNQYSATDTSKNEVFDAMDVMLSAKAPIPFLPDSTITIAGANGNYFYSHAGGDTSITLTVQNHSAASASVSLLDTSEHLLSGWAVHFTPDTVTIAAGASQPVTLTVTAPEQSGYEQQNIVVVLREEGFFASNGSYTFGALSDNTLYPIIYDSVNNGSLATSIELGLPDSMRIHAAQIPISDSTLANYPPQNFPVSIYNDIPILDDGGYYGYPVILPSIQNALNSGKKVFINSDRALYYAADPTAPGGTETPAVEAFYQRLGIDYSATIDRYNTTSGVGMAYAIKGTADPIGLGLSITNEGQDGEFNEVWMIDSNSTALFFSNSIPADVIGSKYEDPVTHGKIVYLGYGLAGITIQSKADTVVGRSINWLLSPPSSGVAELATLVVGITASPNPFHGITQIHYAASQDEQNVIFTAYDILGREVATLPAENAGSSYIATFDGSKLADGTYVIVAHSAKGTSQIRVVNQQ